MCLCEKHLDDFTMVKIVFEKLMCKLIVIKSKELQLLHRHTSHVKTIKLTQKLPASK